MKSGFRSPEHALLDLIARIDATSMLGALFVIITLVVIVGEASGRIDAPLAVVLLLSPIVGLAAILRPAWLIILLTVTPPGLVALVPTRAMVLLLVVTLVAQLVIQGRLSVGWASGMVPFLVLILAAHVFTADVSSEADLAARGFLNLSTYLVLLGLVTYNVTLIRDLEMRQLIDAFLVGAVIVVLLEQTGVPGLVQGGDGTGIASIGRNVAYVAAMGFGLSFTRLLMPDAVMNRHHRGFYGLLAAGFAVVVAQEFVRAAWLSALIVLLLVSLWSHKRRYLVILAFAGVMVVTIPVVKERVLPGYGSGIERALASGDFASGRLDLWNILWPEVAAGLPWGHGYGFTFSLSPERLFGFETFTVEGGTDLFVYPHNDFLFWTLELGLLGFFVMVAFWVHLILAFRWLAKSGPAPGRQHAYGVTSILVTGFLVQLVDNSFAIRAVGGWLFIAAGSIFGLVALAKRSKPNEGRAQDA